MYVMGSGVPSGRGDATRPLAPLGGVVTSHPFSITKHLARRWRTWQLARRGSGWSRRLPR